MHAQSPAFTHFEQNNSDSLTTPQQSLSVTSNFLLFTIGSTMFLNIRWSMYITWKPPTSHWHTVWLPTWKWTFYVIKLAFWINAICCAVHWTRWTLTLTSQCWLWKLVCIVEPSHNTSISKRFYLIRSSYACKSLISAGNGGLSRLCVPRSRLCKSSQTLLRFEGLDGGPLFMLVALSPRHRGSASEAKVHKAAAAA